MLIFLKNSLSLESVEKNNLTLDCYEKNSLSLRRVKKNSLSLSQIVERERLVTAGINTLHQQGEAACHLCYYHIDAWTQNGIKS